MRFSVFLAALLAAHTAGAADIALVISNGFYDDVPDLRAVNRAHDDLTRAYGNAGYEVLEGQNLDREEFRALVQRLEQVVSEADRLIVHYSGHVVSTGDETWLIPVDLDPRGRTVTAFGAAPLAPLMEMAAALPGRAAIFIGAPEGALSVARDFDIPGAGIPVPQGVLLVRGATDKVADAVTERFLVRGEDAASAASGAVGVVISGYVSPEMILSPDFEVAMPEPEPEPEPDPVPPTSSRPGLVEAALWALAEQNPSEANFRAYLARFPNGFYSGAAQRRLDELVASRVDPAEAAEAALDLSREARRAVQEQLTVLGYDTRGVDGIFGRGTRAAISSWQQTESLRATGFLDAMQLELLSSRAEVRSAEIAAEEEERRRQEELADIAFWRATGSSGEAVDLRAYLSRYPDGIYAEEARRELEVIEEGERLQARELERVDWDNASSQNTVSAYRAYLAKYPNGVFAESAQARITELTRDDTDEDKRAEYKRIEDSLGLNTARRALIEQRLKMLRLDPGSVDGRFDDETRRAITRFQRRQGLDETGYLNSVTVQRLIVASSG